MAQPTRHTVRRPTLEKWVRRGLRGFEALSPSLAGWVAFKAFLTPLRDYFPISDEEKAVLQSARTEIVLCERSEFSQRPFGKPYRLQTYVWGNEADPTVLLLHGWMASSSHMGTFVAPLLKAGFRVVALDAPGHGRSSGLNTDIPAFAQGLSAVVHQLGPVDGVIAHSFGGSSAAYLLKEAPHSIAINNLVLLAAPSEISLMMDIICKGLGASPRLRQEMEKRFVQRYGNPSGHYVVADMVVDNPLPGLVIHDRDDPLVPFSEGESIARSWPNSELIATDGLGHGGILRDPAIINRVVEFQLAHCTPRPTAPSQVQA